MNAAWLARGGIASLIVVSTAAAPVTRYCLTRSATVHGASIDTDSPLTVILILA